MQEVTLFCAGTSFQEPDFGCFHSYAFVFLSSYHIITFEATLEYLITVVKFEKFQKKKNNYSIFTCAIEMGIHSLTWTNKCFYTTYNTIVCMYDKNMCSEYILPIKMSSV